MHNQVLVERVRQTAWEMHYQKRNSIIYLFSFADVEVKIFISFFDIRMLVTKP